MLSLGLIRSNRTRDFLRISLKIRDDTDIAPDIEKERLTRLFMMEICHAKLLWKPICPLPGQGVLWTVEAVGGGGGESS